MDSTTQAGSPSRAADLKTVLLLGSGALKIGEAGEFDYSGSQAVKALKEEGIRVVLVNPNIATNQTSENFADRVYFLPVDAHFVTRVIERERPDGILLSFGGQTALNCGLQLAREGTLEAYGVRVLGTPVDTIQQTEDRELFVRRLAEIGVRTPRSEAVTTIVDALRVAEVIGYPVILRAGFALGGEGSGVATSPDALRELSERALVRAPQVLIEEYLGKWKEIEYEIVRDGADNCIAVCNMENFDPMGIHTGESIVVAPSQTLTNAEYQMLRTVAIRTIRHLGVVGECNIQYALHPRSREYRVIEVNARLSRSSALASKATGYPLAYIAAKLALGYTLPELPNTVTGQTSACFEPALDYLVVKYPRWDLDKFKRVDTTLGSAMKSVGEVMAIGRCFEEAIHKAVRMLGYGPEGLLPKRARLTSEDDFGDEQRAHALYALATPTPQRLFDMAIALHDGADIQEISAITGIDAWFVAAIARIVTYQTEMEGEIAATGTLSEATIREAKRLGFSDARLARLLGYQDIPSGELEVRHRRRLAGIVPSMKQIDTLAAEYPATTNYLYCSYGGDYSDITAAAPRGVSTEWVTPSGSPTTATIASVPGVPGAYGGQYTPSNAGPLPGSTEHTGPGTGRSIVILGSGSYRIGSSVEFDWCTVVAARTLRERGYTTIMINHNPETVSTDYDTCDKLYFDELSFERVVDICEVEKPYAVVLSMGGQTPNNLAKRLYEAGVPVLGTSPLSIDRAEDRHKFSALLDELGVEQPPWKELRGIEEVEEFASAVGYPVLVRPSYVLSGSAMNVAYEAEHLRDYLRLARVSSDHPIVVSKFVEHAKELEIDAVAANGKLVIYALTEHVENAGVHSGDATVMLPPQRVYLETLRRIKAITKRVAAALEITGPFNIQFLARENRVGVIECNLRASRSFPFVSKVTGYNFAALAIRAMLGEDVTGTYQTVDLDYVAVKAPQFSFSRLKGADPIVRVEMASTGEVATFGRDLDEAFLKAVLSVGMRLPQRSVFLGLGGEENRTRFLEAARTLRDLGLQLYATRNTSAFLTTHGVPNTYVNKIHEKGTPNVLDLITRREVDLIINVTDEYVTREFNDDYTIRRAAVDFNITLLTNLQVARLFVTALAHYRDRDALPVRAWDEYVSMHA